MKHVNIYFNSQYIEVTSWNDGGCWLLNLDFEPIKLSTNVTNKILGESIQIALNAGKNIPPENVRNILFSPELDSLMTERDKKLMAEFGYKSKKSIIQTYEKSRHNVYQ